jgi:hypothetical protein
VDVRSKVAREAGVSVGNVTKVKQLVKTQSSTLQGALRAGQIRIHKAWKWRQLSPEGQLKELELYLSHESRLTLGEFNGCRALFVVIGDIVDPCADWVTPHLPRIVGLQQF